MIAKIVDAIFQILSFAIRLVARVIVLQFIPAMFIVCVWLTERSLLLLPATASKLRPGLIVILSTAGWSLFFTSIWMILVGWWMGLATVKWPALIGAGWGLAVGGTLAREWSPPTVLQPPFAPDQTMGIHPNMTVDDPEDQTISIDDLLSGGLFVGPDVRHTSRDDS